ncbi:TetR/AcrR family transcriptional regulator [Demequina sp. NBRC 110053]|uniref:TetR/AcrR family transcriptional regulator n=1 Tax=Demequina sp. NBRC 110053 TaxID=1570342 RepID=UPI0013566C2F|nr:TetR/AcrR family transcriptional regulator [Demequina sp. NBRC 110053]
MPDDAPELPHGLALAWGVAPEPTRGPKRELSVQRIVSEAIAIADRDGLAAVSMGNVARACGVTTMALYRYVSSKDDLVLLMSEGALGDAPDLGGLGWRDGFKQWFDAQVAALGRHPWALDIPIKGAPDTPRALAWGDAALGLLAGSGLTVSQRLGAVLAVDAQARWHATLLRRWEDGSRAVEGDAMARVAHLIGPHNLPHFAAVMASSEPETADEDDAAYGLELVLDGIGVAIERARAQAR